MSIVTREKKEEEEETSQGSQETSDGVGHTGTWTSKAQSAMFRKGMAHFGLLFVLPLVVIFC